MEWLKDRKEYWQPSPSGCRAFLISFGFLILGFLTLMIMKSMMNVTQDIVLVAILLLAPVLIFLVLSGKVLEINAGVVSAKFKDTAQEPSFPGHEQDTKQIEQSDVIVVMQEGLNELHEMLLGMLMYKHIILTITIGGLYEYFDNLNPNFLDLLKELAKYPNFTFIAFLKKTGTLIGYFPAQQALQTIFAQEQMKNYLNAKQIVTLETAISLGKILILEDYGLIQETVNSKDSNISALKKMDQKKMSLLIVVDNADKIVGVVERKQVLSKLMLALTDQ